VRLLPSVRGLPRTFWVVWAGALVNRLGSFVMPFLVLYLTGERGYSVARAGAVVSLYGLGSLGAGPAGGLLADRIGRRATMILALALGAAAMVHLGLARAPLHVAVATLLLGFLSEMYRPAVQALVADLVPPADRQRAYGLIYWAVNLGFSVATVVAGLGARHGFAILCAGDAATTLAFAVLVALRVPETRPTEEAAAPPPTLRLLVPLTDGVFVAFVLLNTAIGLVFQQSMVALPVDMRAHGVGPETYGALIAVNGLLIVLLQPFASSALTGYRHASVLAVGVLLTGAGFGVTRFAAGVPMYALSIVAWTLGEIVLAGVAPAVVSELAPPSLRGSYQGVYQMAWGLAAFAAPAAGGFMLGRFGAPALWTWCLIVGAAACVGHLVIGPACRRRIATPAHGARSAITGR
jgi:MFS family permease